METNQNKSTSTVENFIVINHGKNTLRLSDNALERFYALFGFCTIDELINSLKDNIIEISTYKIMLEKEHPDIAGEMITDSDFFFNLKGLIEFLKILKKDNKDCEYLNGRDE